MASVPALRRPVPGIPVLIAPLPRVGPQDLYAAFLADARCENSRRSRIWDIKLFARFLGRDDPSACVEFISEGRGQANALALAFRKAETDRGQSPASVNRALSSLRRVVVVANRLDLIAWTLIVDPLREKQYRDTRGPGRDGWRKLWAAAVAAGHSPRAKRDRAIVRLLHDAALRKGEVIGLDVADVDLAGERVQIMGKGSGGNRTWVAINRKCVDLLREYLEVRGPSAGPLFISRPGTYASPAVELRDWINAQYAAGVVEREIAERLNAEGRFSAGGRRWTQRTVNHARHNSCQRIMPRLPDRIVNRILVRLAKAAGIGHAWPHGLRHVAITTVLDQNNGNIREAARFARHRNIAVTVRYDDNRQDMAAECARRLGEDD